MLAWPRSLGESRPPLVRRIRSRTPGVMGHLHHFSAGAARRPGMGSQGPESTSGLPRWQIAMHKRLRHAPIDHDRRHALQAP